MQKRMIAKYSGIDSRTGYPIRKGDEIIYDTETRKAYITDDDDGLTFQSTDRYVSDIYAIGGSEYYRNKAGKCIDAPCCGCCTM